MSERLFRAARVDRLTGEVVGARDAHERLELATADADAMRAIGQVYSRVVVQTCQPQWEDVRE